MFRKLTIHGQQLRLRIFLGQSGKYLEGDVRLVFLQGLVLRVGVCGTVHTLTPSRVLMLASESECDFRVEFQLDRLTASVLTVAAWLSLHLPAGSWAPQFCLLNDPDCLVGGKGGRLRLVQQGDGWEHEEPFGLLPGVSVPQSVPTLPNLEPLAGRWGKLHLVESKGPFWVPPSTSACNAPELVCHKTGVDLTVEDDGFVFFLPGPSVAAIPENSRPFPPFSPRRRSRD